MEIATDLILYLGLFVLALIILTFVLTLFISLTVDVVWDFVGRWKQHHGKGR